MHRNGSMILNLMACNPGWLEIVHTEEGKIKDSAICCGKGMGYLDTLSWR